MKSALVVAFALLLAAPALAEEERHPLDVGLDHCMGEDPTTHGVLGCISRSHEAWDAELNRVWGELGEALPAETFTKLREAQRAWIGFRDAEWAALDAVYATMQGSMFQVMHANDRMELTRKRVLALQGLLETYRIAKEP